MASPNTRAGDLVPLADRIRALTWFRAAAVVVVLGTAATWAGAWWLPRGVIAATAVAYWLVAYLVGALLLRRRRRALALQGLLLLLDGLGLQLVTVATGGTASPLRYLILVQLAVVALVASYRTGLKLAIWQSLLLLLVREATVTGLIVPTGDAAGEHPGAFVLAIWLVTLATSTASAVNERELRRRRYESEAFAEMATTLETTTFPKAVAEVVVATAGEVLDLARVAMLDTRDGVVLLASRGTGVGEDEGETVGEPADELAAAGDAVIGRVVARRQPVLVARLDETASPLLAGLLPGAVNVAVLPVTDQGSTVAVLVMEYGARAGSRLEQRTLATAERIANHAGLSLANAWLHERLAEHATTDPLTGLANRRAFDDALRAALASDEPLALLLLDLDHFKQVNDVHGHIVGDGVLRGVADALRGPLPPGALPARLGGEEFAVLLTGCTAAEAATLGGDLRWAVAEAPTPVPVTTSVGVCHATWPPQNPADLLHQADLALYEAKREGRNRVSSRPLPDPDAVPQETVSDGRSLR